MDKITNQFEVVEEEARFARNDVHNEALTDFKKMHSQRCESTRSRESEDAADSAFLDLGWFNSMRWWTWKRLTLLGRESW